MKTVVSNMKYAIAGSFIQYKLNIELLGLQDRVDIRYLGPAHSVRGLHNVEILLLGTYMESPAWTTIVEYPYKEIMDGKVILH